jgi:hypothetical protein
MKSIFLKIIILKLNIILCFTGCNYNKVNVRSCIHELNNFFINIIECAIITAFSAESTVIS